MTAAPIAPAASVETNDAESRVSARRRSKEPIGATAVPEAFDDRAALLLPHLDSASAIHLAEAANLARPVLKYLATPPNHRLVPFDRAWLATLHREMFGDVWAWAGRFRDTPIDRAPIPREIDAALGAMLAERAAAIASDVPAIERSTRLLAEAWSIRPFIHGNGRWSRLLVDIDLALLRQPTIAWPLDARSRPVLRDALDVARSGDRRPLEALLRGWQRH
jgi:fido (protein-threonine AMPylation protein)